MNSGEMSIVTSANLGFRINNLAGSLATNMTTAGVWTTLGSFSPASARWFKSNIETLPDPLGTVLDDRLHGVSYYDTRREVHSVGFVADDWLEVVPEVVITDEFGAPEALDYDRIGAITFEALKRYITQTDARLAALEDR
jgi:hypothetical protein